MRMGGFQAADDQRGWAMGEPHHTGEGGRGEEHHTGEGGQGRGAPRKVAHSHVVPRKQIEQGHFIAVKLVLNLRADT